MAGEAKSNSFVLGSATVMIGAQSALWDLTPAANSIGLVKNFQMSAEPSYTELTQGVKNQIVYSVLTANPIRASMEVYEFTSKNLAYGLGLDGSALAAVAAVDSLKTTITGNATPVTTAKFDNAADKTAAYPSGAWVSFQDAGTDRVHVAKLSAATTKTGAGPYEHTLTFANHGFKAGDDMPAGSVISVVNRVDVGSKADQPFFAAKIVSILPEGNKPIVILVPKLRITKGYNLNFATDNFGNMPFEFTPYELTSTDANYAEFLDKGLAMLLSGG